MADATGNSTRRPLRATGPFAQVFLIAVFAAVVALGYWAKDLTITAVSQGEGVISKAENVTPVSSTADGKLVSYSVQEGMAVTKGQLLFRVEQVIETSVKIEPQSDTVALRAAVARLAGEAEGAGRFVFPKGIEGEAATEREAGLFDARRSQLNRELQALRDASAQTRLEFAEQKAAAERHLRARDLAQKELDVLGPLVDRGISPKLEYLRVQQRVQELDALREGALLALPRLEAKFQESDRRSRQVEADFRAEAKRMLSEKRRELAAAQRPKTAAKRQVTATEIRAPIAGKIQRVLAGNAGATVSEGQVLAIMAPPLDEILIDAVVPAASRIGSRVGENATVTFFVLFSAVSAQAAIAEVDAREDGRWRRIKLRVEAETPGFDDLANYDGDVEVRLWAEQPILDYFLDRLSVASGGRIPDILTEQR